MRAMFVVLCTLGALAVLALSGCGADGDAHLDDLGAEAMDGGVDESVDGSVQEDLETSGEDGPLVLPDQATFKEEPYYITLEYYDHLDLETGSFYSEHDFFARFYDYGDIYIMHGSPRVDPAVLWLDRAIAIAYDTEELQDVTMEDLEALEFHDVALGVPMTGETIVLTQEGNYFRVSQVFEAGLDRERFTKLYCALIPLQ